MASIYDKSSLVLIPSGTKTGKVYSQKPVSGDGDFTFTRSSAATRVNADGFIEKETQNLLPYSNTFTSWSNIGGTMVGGQSGYDGSSDAYLFTMSAGANICSQSISKSGVQTLSLYAKGSVSNGLRLYAFGSKNVFTYFDLNIGAVETTNQTIDANIEDMGNDWYRCSMTFDQSTTSVYFYLSNNNNSNASSGSITIQDAQLNQGLIAQEVITTTTTAVEGGITDNVPRLDYTDSSCPALLLEPQRTNLTPQSEYFDSGYTFSNVTTAANAAISPEGVSNAYEMTDDATNGNHRFIRQITGCTIGQSYTYSIFIKKGTMTNAFLNLFSGGTIANVSVDLENGTLSGGGGTSQTIEDYDNDWYRCSITGTAGDTSVYIYLYMKQLSGYVGAGDNMYFYGAQLEAGSYATSYIPTYGSSVTRVAPEASSSLAPLTSNEGTIFLEFDYNGSESSADYRISLTDGGTGNWIFAGVENAGQFRIYVRSNNATNLDRSTTEFTTGNTYKIAFRFKSGNSFKYVNGTREDLRTETWGNFSQTINRINITGSGAGSGSPQTDVGIALKQLLIFPTALSEEELAALTTI